MVFSAIFSFNSHTSNFGLWSSYDIGLLSNVFLLPFWQAIKAVVYYDLRTRREGMGLQLRKQDI
ncbi:hypothetical protein [Okeania sp. KiyG1]|uniref:hypothetical protein n=1 Tax=Okeania sp. KiyG1 TaxID=2720165 RepID=UPI0019B4C968|nr:hypothetical protein [Okeania sp. KiyG1]GFZ94066.1 hypothetical protein CYANOKiyG1_04720 [Okeania sp. KiyG1]